MPSRVKTLNEMTELKESGFGRPSPRHGLKLLYWFSTSCISFDENNEMVSCCNPKEGDYGFHHFENRPDQDGIPLLPVVDFPYYEVGNLNSGDKKLPVYVLKDHTRKCDKSNIDRIIVSLVDHWFDKVYITAHIKHSDEFDINSTFHISPGLLAKISRHQSVDSFLTEMDLCSRPDDSQSITIMAPTTTTGGSDCRIDVEPSPAPQNRDTAVSVTNKICSRTQASTRSPWFWESLCTIL